MKESFLGGSSHQIWFYVGTKVNSGSREYKIKLEYMLLKISIEKIDGEERNIFSL
jgi:hypothetical protein